jgi:hypothetical protein
MVIAEAIAVVAKKRRRSMLPGKEERGFVFDLFILI